MISDVLNGLLLQLRDKLGLSDLLVQPGRAGTRMERKSHIPEVNFGPSITAHGKYGVKYLAIADRPWN